MKIKEIKLKLFISFFLFMFIIFLHLTFRDYNYEKKYVINKYKIIENYNKDGEFYTFSIAGNNKTYSYIIKNKYIRKRELIKKIEVYNNELETCILPFSEKINFYPLCSNDKEVYTYNLSMLEDVPYYYESLKTLNKEYKKIAINNFFNNTFLLYNYKGFYSINEKKNDNIKLFAKDVYTANLIYQKDQYLLIADYNQEYFFNKFFIINILSGKVEELKFEFDIAFDSEFLGDFKNNVYLIDKKQQKEYQINIARKEIEEVEFQILKGNEFVRTTYQNIINNNIKFQKSNIYNYKLVDKLLYLVINDNKIKLSNHEVDMIINNINDTVYYLSGENLYMYNNIYGEVLLLSYFEWNFNNTNMIYLYK